ncbi:MAG: orotidine-5'-phosphate decarboxylase [bacterium]|nr:orotidine-5'-phosphate decarboxylase [bacterium]
MHYADRLHAAVRTKGNPCLVGLDPHPASIPAEFAAVHDAGASRAEKARAIGDFLCQVVELVADRAPAVKPQSAFFELYGADGVAAWERVVGAARAAGLVVIGDVKRGDIGSTAAAYAAAFLGGEPGADAATRCDAVTINPYLGTDSVRPFLDACEVNEAGLYVLVRTSNPSSAEFQATGEPPLARRVAAAVEAWGAELVGEGGWSDVGAVVGATHPEELAELRRLLPRTPFLLPGFGAQGAGAADVAAGFGEDGLGAIVNSSRGILYAYERRSETNWRDATRAALDEMAEQLAHAIAARH